MKKKLMVSLGILLGMLMLQGCNEANGMAIVKEAYPGASVLSRYDVANLLPPYTYIVVTSNRTLIVKDRGQRSLEYLKKLPMVTPERVQVIKE